MDELFEKFQQKIGNTSIDFIRSTIDEILWNTRLIGIKGPRGVGKTTLLLQYIKQHLSNELARVLYVSLDDIWFANHTLSGLANDFVKRGGKYLFLDEVHKYPNWSQELKNLYDDYPALKIVFTGSSLLEILNARADLSRRAIIYTMQGFSFREYIRLETGIAFEKLSLEQILKNHVEEARHINRNIRPFQYFENYLQHGYYPFYREQLELYSIRLGEVVNMMLEIELPLLRGVDLAYIHKVKQLLLIIAESVPFVPNISKLSEKIGINRTTLLSYLHYLEEIGLTRNLHKEAFGITRLQKPAKIFLENTNLIFMLASQNSNVGNVRETFFANQVSHSHQLRYVEQGDFLIDDRYIMEIGGKNKTGKQLQETQNGFIISDHLEYGFGNKIPLWLFGFMY